jgi:hypothetical protein
MVPSSPERSYTQLISLINTFATRRIPSVFLPPPFPSYAPARKLWIVEGEGTKTEYAQSKTGGMLFLLLLNLKVKAGMWRHWPPVLSILVGTTLEMWMSPYCGEITCNGEINDDRYSLAGHPG